MMFARIFKPSKTPMQSGQAKTTWVLEFDAETARYIDPLMGWTSSDETRSGQVRLDFADREAAINYATRHNIAYQLIDVQKSVPVIKTYADNFAYRRRKPWTH